MGRTIGPSRTKGINMRPVRSSALLVVVSAVSMGCGTAVPGAGTPSPTAPGSSASPQSTPTQPPAGTLPPVATPTAGATAPPATTFAPADSNKITYEISGEYEASGEAVFNEQASIYWEEGQYDSHEGWVAYFDAGNISMRVSTRPENESIEFRDGERVVVANSYPDAGYGCTFTLTRNTPSGPVGSAVCERAIVHPNGSTYVNVELEWEVNL